MPGHVLDCTTKIHPGVKSVSCDMLHKPYVNILRFSKSALNQHTLQKMLSLIVQNISA